MGKKKYMPVFKGIKNDQMREVKCTENTLEHTWETVPENPALGGCSHRGLHTTGDSDSSAKSCNPVAKCSCSELSYESRHFPYPVLCQRLSNNKAYKKGKLHKEMKGAD